MKQTSIPGMSEHELESQALSELSAAHYKDAIRLIKKIILTSDDAEWQEKLAFCYLQRAKQFALKSMYKEAIELWEIHMQYTQAPYGLYDLYLFCLMRTNSHDKLQIHIGKLSAQQLDKDFPALATVLGVLIITEHPEFEQILPQDSAFIAHCKIVRTALLAYQENDYDKLNESLRLLPYRSAFRDFRTLLSALIAIPDSIEQAQEQLNKIPANSPYFPAGKVLFACTKEGAELAEYLLQMSHLQCQLISEIKGLHKKQFDFIQYFTRHNDKLSDKVKFNMVIRYQALLGKEFAQTFCQALLANYPAGKKDFKKYFGKANGFEENRVKALNCELGNNPYDAEFYWRNCVDILAKQESDNDLEIALILRRLASKESDGEAKTDFLIDSLTYDPDDRTSYLQIIQYYSEQSETAKEYKLWLANTLKQFPQDVEVLTQAVKAATRNKTYSKASQYATKILTIDPLNSFAKQTLFTSYLANARRLMREKKYHLVEKEINKAEKLNLGKEYQKQVQLMRALLCFANENKQLGLQQISKALDALHKCAVNSHFQATMEALLNGFPVATILRELPAIKEHLLSAQELNDFILQLKQYTNNLDDRDYIQKAMDKIKAPLKKSLSEHDYDESLLISLCQELDKIEHYELLRHSAKTIPLKGKKTIWIYYQIYAENNGDARDCTADQIRRIQLAQDRAYEDKDYQTSMLIDTFLERYFATHPQIGTGFFDDLFGDYEEDEEEFYDPMEELFGHLDEGILNKLNNKAESIIKKVTPEKLIEDVMQNFGNNESIIVAIMQNPDILSALVLLKAADELHLAIEVDIDDVIDTFEITDNGKPFPFPF